MHYIHVTYLLTYL